MNSGGHRTISNCQLLVAQGKGSVSSCPENALTRVIGPATVSDAHRLADQSPAKGRMASPVSCTEKPQSWWLCPTTLTMLLCLKQPQLHSSWHLLQMALLEPHGKPDLGQVSIWGTL